MVVCSSRAAAVEMYEVLKGMSGINPRVVITFGDKREGDDDETTDETIKKIRAYYQKTLTLSDCDITSEIGWVKSKELPLSPLAEEAIKMIRDLLIPNTWELSGRIKG